MPDMLVKLYDLPDDAAAQRRVADAGVHIRRGMTYDAARVRRWLETHFPGGWPDEVEAGLRRTPTTVFLAIDSGAGAPDAKGELLGFAAYDTTARGFFGPMGTRADAEGRGIGAALLHTALRQMRADGYGYAIIGLVGPAGFYKKQVGAIAIPDSEPGVYAHFLKRL